jgi:hypothetical protein
MTGFYEHKAIFVFALIAVLWADQSLANIGYSDFEMVGRSPLLFKKIRTFGLRQDVGFFEGTIVNDQTSGKRVDRRFFTRIASDAEIPILANMSVRGSIVGIATVRRQVDQFTPEIVSDEKQIVLNSNLAATYVTPAGLEVYGGIRAWLNPKYSQEVDSLGATTSIRRPSARLVAQHLGLTRRFGSGAGGFYYQFGKEETREVTKVTSGIEDVVVSETLHAPTTLAMYGKFQTGSTQWTLEAASLSSGEGGERTETGSTIRDDFLKLYGEGVFDSFYQLGIGYQTAKYSKSAYIDLDSVPLWILKGAIVQGTSPSFTFLAAELIVGRDKQSIPEINARYESTQLTISLGVNLVF